MGFVRDAIFGKPPPPPDYSSIANSNKEIAQEQIALAREQGIDAKADRQRLLDLTQESNTRQQAIADAQEKRSQEYYDDYKTNYAPLGQKLAKQADEFSTEAARNRIAGQAGADVAQAFTNVEGQQLRSAARYGIGRPNANSFAAVNNQMLANKAGAIAGAQTNAGFAARDQATNMLTNATNVGKGLPGFAQGASALASGANSAGAGAVISGQGAINQTAMVPVSTYGAAVGSNNAAANILNTGFSNQFNNWATQGQQTGAMLNFAGAMLGGRANGGYTTTNDYGVKGFGSAYSDGGSHKGQVQGPGTGISDDIPARLSNGEYVIPADVVKRKGVEFFDKLLEKYHMPAAEQQRRYGIGGR